MRTSFFLLVTFFCLNLTGCGAIDERVYFSVNIDGSQQQHTVEKSNTSQSGLSVFINGNLCEFRREGFAAGPVDKYIKPGSNTIEIQGTTIGSVEIVIGTGANHSPVDKILLKQKVSATPSGIKWRGVFRVKKALSFHIFEGKNKLPNCQQAEQEIGTIVRELYNCYISGKKQEFMRIALEGYCRHSPSEYENIASAMGPMFDGLKLKSFPEELHFVYGSNLVRVYSSIVDNEMVLFEGKANSASVDCLDFAYIDGRWVVW